MTVDITRADQQQLAEARRLLWLTDSFHQQGVLLQLQSRNMNSTHRVGLYPPGQQGCGLFFSFHSGQQVSSLFILGSRFDLASAIPLFCPLGPHAHRLVAQQYLVTTCCAVTANMDTVLTLLWFDLLCCCPAHDFFSSQSGQQFFWTWH